MWVYDANLKTYKTDTPAPRIKCEVGDETDTENVQPRLKLKLWDNECNFSVGVPLSPGMVNKIEVVDGVLIFEAPAGNLTLKFYQKPDTEDTPSGAMEFEVILHKKPSTNTIELSLSIPKGLTFHYQAPLTQEEIDEGAYQPENVAGSYAVYHTTCGQMHKEADAEKYKTGKAFHIYRPHLTDADGREVWADLNIDLEAQKMTITVPQQFLNTAKYPVVVDPTFGYTGVGGSSTVIDFYVAQYGIWQFVCGGAGESVSISGYYDYAASKNVSLWHVIYEDDTDIPTDKLSQSSEQASIDLSESGAQWITLNIGSLLLQESVKYWLTFFMIEGLRYYYDTVSNFPGRKNWTSEDEEPRAIAPSSDQSYTNRRISIYCTYSDIPVPSLAAAQVGSIIRLTVTPGV